MMRTYGGDVDAISFIDPLQVKCILVSYSHFDMIINKLMMHHNMNSYCSDVSDGGGWLSIVAT